MGRFLGYLNSKTVDSEQQLRDAQQKSRSYTAEQNAQARAAGFKNADEMVLFLKAKQNKSHDIQHGLGSVSDGLTFQNLFSFHPINTLNRATEALRKATDK